MITRSCLFATFVGPSEEWEALATAVEAKGEKRLAKTIRNGIRRQERKYYHYPGRYIPRRFRDGSIAKIEAASQTLFPSV
jgi:hypothetical protein